MAGAKLTVVAKIKAKPGMEARVKEELLALVAPTRSEPGCVNYDLHQALDDKSAFVFYENWRSKRDLDEHLQMPYLQALLGKVDQILAQPVEITLWEMISPEDK
ncbi:MAG: putative quinol monooxygenase [Desulfobaccales bacterium]